MSFTYDYMYWRLFCKSYLLTWFESSRAISYSKIIRGKHDKTKSLARCSEPAVHMLTLRTARDVAIGRLERPAEWSPMGWFQSASLRLRPDRISDTKKNPCERRYRLFKTLF